MFVQGSEVHGSARRIYESDSSLFVLYQVYKQEISSSAFRKSWYTPNHNFSERLDSPDLVHIGSSLMRGTRGRNVGLSKRSD